MQWYQHIAIELQESFARGTQKQLEDINQYGEYHIQGSGDTVLYREIESTKEQSPPKRWALEELQEFESKLILITRHDSPWKEDKSNFQKVCRNQILIFFGSIVYT